MPPLFRRHPSAVTTARQSRQRVQKRRLMMEQLEDRRLLAVASWHGGGDLLWSNPQNWSNDQLPGAADDVKANI